MRPRVLLQFELKHVFDAPIEEVLDAVFDPRLVAYLKTHMKLIRHIQPMEHVDEGNLVRRKVRYVPVPIIAKLGPKKIPPEALAWIEESTFDRAARQIRFKNIGEHEKVRRHVDSSGTLTFRELGQGRTERLVAGELTIGTLPLLLRPLGAIAERLIHSNAQDIINEEARVFADFLKAKITGELAKKQLFSKSA